MAIAWALLRDLPRGELTRLSDAQIARHLEAADTAPAADG